MANFLRFLLDFVNMNSILCAFLSCYFLLSKLTYKNNWKQYQHFISVFVFHYTFRKCRVIFVADYSIPHLNISGFL